MQFPERHTNHTLEQKSELFFLHSLPTDWNYMNPKKDYGQDLNIEICEDGQYRGLDLIVQLKSSKTPDTLDDAERLQLKVSTYNYLWNNLRVVMLVKYIEDENEAYWTLLKDVSPPGSQNQERFTVNLPKQNRLSEINWTEITDYVRSVTDKKLAAQRVANALQKLRLEVQGTRNDLKKEKDTLSQLHSEIKIKFSGEWNKVPYPSQILSPIDSLYLLQFQDSKNQHPQIVFYATEQYQFTTIDCKSANFFCRQSVKHGEYPLGQDIGVLFNYDRLNFFIPFIMYENIRNSKIVIEEINIILHINGKTTRQLFHKTYFEADVKIHNNDKSQGWTIVELSSPTGQILNEFVNKK